MQRCWFIGLLALSACGPDRDPPPNPKACEYRCLAYAQDNAHVHEAFELCMHVRECPRSK